MYKLSAGREVKTEIPADIQDGVSARRRARINRCFCALSVGFGRKSETISQ